MNIKFSRAVKRRAMALCLLLAGVTSIGACSSGSAGSSSASPTPSASSTLFSSLPQSIQDSGVITIGTTAEYPPCEFFEDDSTDMVGFEPDLWNAIAAKLGVTVKAESIDFSSLVPGVQNGKYDVAMECVRDTEERESQVTMVDYIYGEVGFLFKEENSNGISDDPLSVCGLTAAIVTGSTNEDRLQKINDNCTANGKDEATILQVPAQSQALTAIQSGQADFTIQDVAAATYITQTSSVPMSAVATDFIPKGYLGAVIASDNTELQNAWLAGLKEIIADGTYDQILQKWGLSDLHIGEPGINLATASPIE